ncbi:MAG: primosomal protein N' [Bacteroidales bacterium]
MDQNRIIVDLILPLPVSQLYSYFVPESLQNKVLKGKRAIVQFGRKKIYSALIVDIKYDKQENYELKEIIDIIDDQPIVNSLQLQFWQWMTDYYMCTLGEVFKAALPAGLRLESNTKISYNSFYFENTENDNFKKFTPKESLILDALSKENSLTINEISEILNIKNSLPYIKTLCEKGAVLIEENIDSGFKPKYEKFICLSPEYSSEEKLNGLVLKLKKANKQLELLYKFIEISDYENGYNPVEIARKEVLTKSGSPPSALDELIKKGIFNQTEKEISRLYANHQTESKKLISLTNEQETAYQEIRKQFEEKNTVLLHGVTSSGKTELYIKLIQNFISESKQVLYLLPEIALTSQIIERLRKVFGNEIGVYHSKYNDSERVETWLDIVENNKNNNSGHFKIILGVRSSIFLPFSNLGLIIVDEEHENTYKQYNPAPRYHARDSALMLARIHNAKTLLGSATPSLESYYNTKTGKYGLVKLNSRYLDLPMPEVIISDVKESRRKKQLKSHYTPVLLQNIAKSLQENKQVILFQNRRGYALYLECLECGQIPKCIHCDVSLTYHRHTNQLLCHYCGYTQTITNECNFCRSVNIRSRGFGTEKIEEELKIFFPDAKIKRMDLDSARGKKAHSKLIYDIENQNVDIIIGTQMISKGLDFENVNLVGILDANQMLSYPDFRSYEKSYQLMAQVGGRAGRKNTRGKVIIQTSTPENHIINYVVRNDYEGMFKNQAMERKQFKYPPFYRLIQITLKHKDKNTLDKASEYFANRLKKNIPQNVIGPEYPIVSKTFDHYLKSILVKSENATQSALFKTQILEIERDTLQFSEFKSLQIIYDVDPY